jgi:DNA-binding transcriptional MerR regulator
MLNPTADPIAKILFQLRRILKLGADSTLEDITAALDALEQAPEALTALSALLPVSRESGAEKISRLLGVTPEMLRKWG